MNTFGLRWAPAALAASLAAGGLESSCARRPPAAVRLILRPPLAYVAQGALQQFALEGQSADGRLTSVSATLTATGGSIDADGSYEAGQVPGTYLVIATQTGGRLSDTSVVEVTPAGSHSYATVFPGTENPISEAGRWIGGGAGLDWADVSTTPGLAIGHQGKVSYSDATAILTGSWGPDQRASASVYSVNPKDPCYEEVELRLRSAIATHINRGYEITFQIARSATPYLQIVRWNGAFGDFTYLLDRRGTQYGLKTGDVVGAAVVGSAITAYKNGVLVGEVTDTTFTSGNPGMGFNLEAGRPTCWGRNGDYGLTSYAATDAAKTSPPPRGERRPG